MSFQSVNYPTRYLRHYNYALRLDVNDGTTHVRGGRHLLPGGRPGRLQLVVVPLVQLPDRYIRHSNYVLRIDPISSSSASTDKQDATFRITS